MTEDWLRQGETENCWQGPGCASAVWAVAPARLGDLNGQSEGQGLPGDPRLHKLQRRDRSEAVPETHPL